MNLSRLERGELIAAVGGLLLALGVFLDWYSTSATNRNSKINDFGPGESLSAWQVHPILRILLLLAAAAPLILLWIIIREHQLSWPRGEVTAIVAITAAGLIFYTGIIDRPGEPPATIGLKYGWFVALLGTIVMMVGAVQRSTEVGKARKPPGIP